MITLGFIASLCLLLVGIALWKKDFVKAGIWLWRFGFVLEARQATPIHELTETKVNSGSTEKS